MIGRETADDKTDHPFFGCPVFTPATSDANALELLVWPNHIDSLVVHAIVDLNCDLKRRN